MEGCLFRQPSFFYFCSSNTNNMKRLFIAIKIKPDEKLINLISNLKLKLRNENINWVNTGNIHLTLKFLGETGVAKIPEIEFAIENVCKKYSLFDIQISGLGIFGSKYQPKVLWCGINKNNSLEGIAEDIIDAMDKIGFIKDRQNFVPHLTLARIKHIENKTSLFNEVNKHKDTYFKNETINEIILFESILKKTGAEYSVISKFNLNEK